MTDFLRKLHSVLPKCFEVRLETPPGRRAQVDIAELTVGVADGPRDPLFPFVRDQACRSMVRHRREHAAVRPPALAPKLALAA